MAKQIGGERMRELADLIKKEIPGLGFALLVYEFGENDALTNYISNSKREDMVLALGEVLERFKNKGDFMTPNKN